MVSNVRISCVCCKWQSTRPEQFQFIQKPLLNSSIIIILCEGNWQQAETWNMIFARVVMDNACVQETLRWFTQWLWIKTITWAADTLLDCWIFIFSLISSYLLISALPSSLLLQVYHITILSYWVIQTDWLWIKKKLKSTFTEINMLYGIFCQVLDRPHKAWKPRNYQAWTKT